MDTLHHFSDKFFKTLLSSDVIIWWSKCMPRGAIRGLGRVVHDKHHVHMIEKTGTMYYYYSLYMFYLL